MKRIFSVVMVLLLAGMLNGCDDWDDLVDSVGGSGDDDSAAGINIDTSKNDKKEDTTTSSASSTGDSTSSQKFHHYNPRAFWGKGVAIVFCPNQAQFESCTLNDTAMTLHGNQDEHRDVWKILGKTGTAGTVVCTKGGSSYSFTVSGSKMHYGSCN